MTVRKVSEGSYISWALPHWLSMIQCFANREVILGNVCTSFSVEINIVSSTSTYAIVSTKTIKYLHSPLQTPQLKPCMSSLLRL